MGKIQLGKCKNKSFSKDSYAHTYLSSKEVLFHKKKLQLGLHITLPQ